MNRRSVFHLACAAWTLALCSVITSNLGLGFFACAASLILAFSAEWMR